MSPYIPLVVAIKMKLISVDLIYRSKIVMLIKKVNGIMLMRLVNASVLILCISCYCIIIIIIVQKIISHVTAYYTGCVYRQLRRLHR